MVSFFLGLKYIFLTVWTYLDLQGGIENVDAILTSVTWTFSSADRPFAAERLSHYTHFYLTHHSGLTF